MTRRQLCAEVVHCLATLKLPNAKSFNVTIVEGGEAMESATGIPLVLREARAKVWILLESALMPGRGWQIV